MPAKAVVDAVEDWLGDTWNGLPVVGANTAGEAPDGATSFILVQYPVSSTSGPTIKPGYYREEGGFRIVLNTERGHGAEQALTWSDKLAALFRDQDLGSGVKCQVPSSPFIDDSNDTGNFFQAAIVVPYTYDFQP